MNISIGEGINASILSGFKSQLPKMEIKNQEIIPLIKGIISEKDKKSIGEENNSKNNLTKGELSDSFIYSDLKLKKSGKDIKEKVTTLQISYNSQKDIILEEIKKSQKDLNIEPDREIDIYYLKNNKTLLSECPKIISYDMMSELAPYQKNDSSYWGDKSLSENSIEEEEIRDKRRLMEVYNEKVYKYCDIVSSLFIIKTLLASFEDKKQYELNLKQLIALGY